MSEFDETVNELELVDSGLHWSRREMLKKTAIAGGVIAWSIPAIELIGSGIAAAASAPTLGANCTITVPGVSTLVPTSSNTTTVAIKYNTSTTDGLTDTITIDAAGTITYGGTNFGFTLTSNDTLLTSTQLASDTVTVISVTVNGVAQGQINGTYQNCNPFAIQATGS
jgi:hypothetical protein